MSKFTSGLKHEILEAVPPFFLILAAFHPIALLGGQRMRALFLGPLSAAGSLDLQQR